MFFKKKIDENEDKIIEKINRNMQNIFINDKYKTYDVNFDSYREEVINCPPVASAFSEIKTSFKNIKFGVYKIIDGKHEKINNKFVENTLRTPNNILSYSDMMEYMITYKLFGGLQVVEKLNGITDADLILYAPSKIVDIEYNDKKMEIKSITFNCGTKIQGSYLKRLYIKTNVDPTTDIAGMTAGYTHYKALGQIADLLNFIIKHNISLTKNSGHATGLFIPKDGNQNMQGKSYDILKNKINKAIGSYKRAGKSIIMPLPMDYIDLEKNSKDLDWVKGYEMGVKMVASIMGVPLALMTSEGATYNNLKEARKSFNRNTIIPLAIEQAEYLTDIFSENLNDNEFIYFDISSINDLKEETDSIVEILIKADFLTINEKRQIFKNDTGRYLEDIMDDSLNKILISSSLMNSEDILVNDVPEEEEEDE